MNFAWPWCFLLVLPLAAAAWRMLRRGRHAGVKFAPVFRLPVRTAGWRARVAELAPFIFLAGAALLVVAAARPRTRLARESRSVNAIAIAMVVDVSGSMEALDLTPKGEAWRTRLDVVKDLFGRFVEARPDDLIGLVTFGGFASTRMPLTADHEALLHVLKGVEVPSSGYDANGRPIDPEETLTAIGDGLATGLARLKDAQPKSKIAILLSDGVSNAGAIQPAEAAAAAARLGVKVYAIGVGTNGRAPFRQRDMFGRTAIAYADITFDESQLQSIAETTGARYFSVRDAQGLKSALDEIDTLEKTPLDRDVYQRYREHFAPFLLLGVLLVFAAVSLEMGAARRLV